MSKEESHSRTNLHLTTVNINFIYCIYLQQFFTENVLHLENKSSIITKEIHHSGE
uniref:Uncharacterized protein MANES_14G157300 n=1 Tax=Rhizophora mucronata TaxID=61149 RepID=A0A2P2KPE1_RHIMU